MAKTDHRVNLSDRRLKSLKPAEAGQRYQVMDAEVGGFGVRVTDSGGVTFILRTRYPGEKNAARRSLGEYPSTTLAEAREKARKWKDLVKRGVDPAEEEERQRRAQAQQRANNFAAVAEEYITKKVARTAKARATTLEIRNELIGRWATRPITDITRHDVIRAIEEIGDRAPYQGHNVFGHLRALFNWAIARGIAGLEHSPCDRLRPTDMLPAKQPRQRVLSDAELRVYWQACEALGFPYGPLFRLLAITGQRKSECAGARWSEIDLQARLWIIPAARMKAAESHTVPLSNLAVELLEALPRFADGDYLFSTTSGAKPVNGFSKAKERLDAAMTALLGAELPPFVLHDVRRSVRSRLSALAPSDICELVIAHARPGLRRTYDLYSFESEKRQALDAWAARLPGIVEPQPETPNVVSLRVERSGEGRR